MQQRPDSLLISKSCAGNFLHIGPGRRDQDHQGQAHRPERGIRIRAVPGSSRSGDGPPVPERQGSARAGVPAKPARLPRNCTTAWRTTPSANDRCMNTCPALGSHTGTVHDRRVQDAVCVLASSRLFRVPVGARLSHMGTLQHQTSILLTIGA